MIPIDAADGALLDLTDELALAQERFAPFNSPHEGIAVIEEEFLELRQHVYGNTGTSTEARDEALQIAAMALRYIIDLCAPR
jgi:hypothetical protein